MKLKLNNSTIFVRPSEQLLQHIKSVHISNDTPKGITNILNGCYFKDKAEGSKYSCLLSDKDRAFIKNVDVDPVTLNAPKDIDIDDGPLLSINDLLWLWKNINESDDDSKSVYLHELLSDSAIVLPRNEEIPRNEELDKRCELLKVQRENQKYKAMTKNVDCVRRPLPEDTISYQLKEMNKQLIAIVQFIMSVLTGFVFGFMGVELMVGSLDFGFRLLLGVICSLSIALAELYFLAKKLNENSQFEVQAEKRIVHSKID